MPHERIYSIDGDPNHINSAQIVWEHPASSNEDRPGSEYGRVVVAIERPGTPARTACSVEEVRRRLEALLSDRSNPAVQTLVSRLTSDVIDIPGLLAEAIGPDLVYAFGAPLELLAVTIDRKGCNKAISALRRGRDAAFGKDE